VLREESSVRLRGAYAFAPLATSDRAKITKRDAGGIAAITTDPPLTQNLIISELPGYRSKKAERGQASSTPQEAETGIPVRECRLSLGLVTVYL
jgi:hypothetical protein